MNQKKTFMNPGTVTNILQNKSKSGNYLADKPESTAIHNSLLAYRFKTYYKALFQDFLVFFVNVHQQIKTGVSILLHRQYCIQNLVS